MKGNQTEPAMPRLPILPSEIIFDILSRLPVKCLLRFKCVSKAWRSQISSPKFAKMHLEHAKEDNGIKRHKIFVAANPLLSIDPETCCDGEGNLLQPQLNFPVIYPDYYYIEIVGSCDGLVCGIMSSDDGQQIHVWNPSTRESREVVVPNSLEPRKYFYGFGYDPKLDDYKIVLGSIADETKLKVFTLKSNVWRTIEGHQCNVHLEGIGTLANGKLHWPVKQQDIPDKIRAVASFDLVEEKFSEMVPLTDLPDYEVETDLDVLAEYLIVYEPESFVFEAWIMKKYGINTSWTRLLRSSSNPLPGSVTNNGNFIFKLDGTEVVLFDPKLDTSTAILIDDQGDWGESTVYLESLVSPHGSGGFDG